MCFCCAIEIEDGKKSACCSTPLPKKRAGRPDRKTLKAIADAEQDKDLSPCFDSVDELMEDLEK